MIAKKFVNVQNLINSDTLHPFFEGLFDHFSKNIKKFKSKKKSRNLIFKNFKKFMNIKRYNK